MGIKAISCEEAQQLYAARAGRGTASRSASDFKVGDNSARVGLALLSVSCGMLTVALTHMHNGNDRLVEGCWCDGAGDVELKKEFGDTKIFRSEQRGADYRIDASGVSENEAYFDVTCIAKSGFAETRHITLKDYAGGPITTAQYEQVLNALHRKWWQ